MAKKDKVRLAVNCTKQERQKIEAAAKAAKRSMNSFVVLTVMNWIQQEGRQ